LSNDFLRFAQLRDLHRTPTNLQSLIDDLLDFYGPSARQAGVDIKTFLPADLPLVSLDYELFQQGLLSLALNAVQAMPQGGTLSITAEARGGEVYLSFIDTGVGIPPEVRARIFDPFFTTKSAGNGLGLPTLRRIVEAHGGRVEVQSEPGKGTKFTLVLPVGA
jgi:signal transduction histidine kinase